MKIKWRTLACIFLGLGGLCIALLMLSLFSTQRLLDKMVVHYEKHEQDLQELKRYAVQVLDDGCALRLEIHRGDVPMFAYATKDMRELEWTDDYRSKMSSIGLTQHELDTLIALLQKADCIGLNISDHTVIDIWWHRSYLDLYAYILLDEPMDQEKWEEYDDYSTIPYCDTVVFRYGAPAFGDDAISTEVRNEFHEKYHQGRSSE